MNKFFIAKYVIIISIFYSILLFAQDNTEKGLEITGIDITEIEGNSGKRWAICIGINDYEELGIVDLEKAQNDAHAIGVVLQEQGQFDQVYIMTDDLNPRDNNYPDLRNIERKLDFLEGFIEPEDLVIFFFSGHGISNDNGEGYLIVADTYPEDAYSSSLPIDTVITWLNNIGVTKSLLLIDACRETFEQGKSLSTDGLREEFFEMSEVAATFYSTESGWFSYEDHESDYGVFTRFLVEGLKGSADSQDNGGNEDGIITFFELAGFVEEGVFDWAIRNNMMQRPYTRIYGEKFGDLALTVAYIKSDDGGFLFFDYTDAKIYYMLQDGTIIEIPEKYFPFGFCAGKGGIGGYWISKDANIIVSYSGSFNHDNGIYVSNINNNTITNIMSNVNYDFYIEDVFTEIEKILYIRDIPDINNLSNIILTEVVLSDFEGIYTNVLYTTNEISDRPKYSRDARFINENNILFCYSANNNTRLININSQSNTYETIFELNFDTKINIIKIYNNNIIFSYIENNNTKICDINLLTKNLRIIAELNQMQNYFGDLSFDNKLIFNGYSTNDKDGYIDLNSDEIVYFSFDSSFNGSYRWCSSNNEIIYISEINGKEDLYLMNIYSGEKNRITYTNSSYLTILDWINDGKDLVFYILDLGTSDFSRGLYKVSNNGFVLQPIISNRDISKSAGCACPHLFLYNGNDFTEIGEIIGRFIYSETEGIDRKEIESSFIINNKIVIRIKEFLNEITYLNSIKLTVGRSVYEPINCPDELLGNDTDYIILNKDEYIELEFDITGNISGPIILETTGFYIPLD